MLAYYQASQLFPFELEDTAFLEMRDTGELALIADESLRKRIADYYHMSGSGIRADILRQRGPCACEVTPSGASMAGIPGACRASHATETPVESNWNAVRREPGSVSRVPFLPECPGDKQ